LTRIALILLALVAAVSVMAQESPGSIDLDQARSYFQEIKDLCEQDAGVLWGRSLCVPVAFIHPQTREIVANRPDSAGRLSERDGVYVGVWPDTLSVANSTAVWSGTRWTTLMWPMPGERISRTSLMLHECFHNIEDDLGFVSLIPANAHLDSREGRTWLRLEWRALKAALTSSGDTRKQAVRDALVFRAHCRGLFPGSAETERTLEMHEGLAEYTGVALSGLEAEKIPAYVAGELYQSRTGGASFISSFAYWSGPAYGTLLDELSPTWRKGLTADKDLGIMLQTALRIDLPPDLLAAAGDAAGRYDGAQVMEEERAREEEHNRMLAALTARFVDGLVLILPLRQMNLQYDPRGMVAMGDNGTVYATIRIADLWGIVEVAGRGALMAPGWNELRVTAPTDPTARPLQGDGWTLQLNEGWEVIPATRAGDLTLQLKE
jgi:hypothetical protein